MFLVIDDPEIFPEALRSDIPRYPTGKSDKGQHCPPGRPAPHVGQRAGTDKKKVQSPVAEETKRLREAQAEAVCRWSSGPTQRAPFAPTPSADPHQRLTEAESPLCNAHQF
ncbi:hypothetical protein AAFF_G00340250 [Aldrovandia affinis]|uniref:Uncharacterized protein n=1 Tax=Aldrovandia affinis TaxID=143900 RepID=A0AAD7SKF1_9TELE|nr:hypothetical protein AAFF_G00340250 [Aldrovandia affinis]